MRAGCPRSQVCCYDRGVSSRKNRGGERHVAAENELLGDVLHRLMPDASRRTLKQIVEHGRVRVGGRPVTRLDHPVAKGTAIEIAPRGAPAPVERPLPQGLSVVFQDDAILVAEKPAAQPTATSYQLSATENDQKIQKALAKTVTLDFSDTPLRDAVAEIGKQHGIRVWLDDRALADLNITSETPVTRKLSDVSLKSALQLLLRDLQLTFRVDHGVLQITSQAAAFLFALKS